MRKPLLSLLALEVPHVAIEKLDAHHPLRPSLALEVEHRAARMLGAHRRSRPAPRYGMWAVRLGAAAV